MSFPKVSGHGLRDFRGTRKYDFMVVADEVGRWRNCGRFRWVLYRLGQQPRKTAWINSRKPMKTIHKKQLMNGDMNKNHSRSRKAAQMSWCDPQCIPAVWWRGQSSPGKGQGLAIDLTIGPYLDGLYATLRSSPFHPFGTKWIYMNLPKNPNRPQYRGSTNHQPTIQISCWMRRISSWISARPMLGRWSGNFTITGNSDWMQ